MNKPVRSIFRTKELSFATFLASKGVKYLGPEPITETSYYFTFENPEKCFELEKEFFTFKKLLYKSIENENN